MVQLAGRQIPKWLVVLVAVLLIGVLSGIVSRCAGGGSSESSVDSGPKPTPAPAPAFADGEVSDPTVRATLADIDVVKVEVQDNLGTDAPDDKIVHITYRPAGAAALGEKPMLMDLVKVSADTFEKLFANPKVGAADVTAAVVMSSGGKDEQTAGARIYWDRTTADGVDFKTYEADIVNGYFWDAFTQAPDSYVHPGVLAGLSEADQAKLQR